MTKTAPNRRLAAIHDTALALLCAAAAWLPIDSALAQQAVSVELNKLEPNGDACRAYLVLENRSERAFETLKLDLVLFDADGVVARRLAVETAPLPAGKISLKVFDIAGLNCPSLGRVLLNDVLSCADAGGALDGCLDLLAPAGRGDLEFVK